MALRRGLVRALDLLLPPSCLCCDAPVDATGQLCATCFRAITFLGAPCCERCGQGFSHAGQAARELPGRALVCERCAANPPPWGRARAALLYDAASRRLVLGFKHADRTEHAGPIAAMMARAGAVLLRDAEVIVPVPLHRSRLLARRYNQAALLAAVLAKLGHRTLLPDALRRMRATASLGHLSPAARVLAVRAAIIVRRGRERLVVGRRVLLVDDVLTSGATAGACADALLAAGAAAVDVLVAARAGALE